MKTTHYIISRSISTALGMLACWFLPICVCASVQVDGIYYELNTSAKTAAVASNPNYYSGTVSIPSSFVYEGVTYRVTSIGSTAFLDCNGMTAIYMPSSVTSIASSAFERCKGLTNLKIGSGVTTINYEAFKNCSNLISLILPASVKTISDEVFSGCTSLTEIVAERTTAPTISSTTFNGVDKISCTVYVPEGYRSSYANAANWKTFSNIVERTVVATGSCGDNVTYTIYSDMSMVISGTGAMADFEYDYDNEIGVCRENNELWKDIKFVTIEEGVTSIGDYAFCDCIYLASVAIPNSVIEIGDYAFSQCVGLPSLTIPNSVAIIGYYAFYGCDVLTSIIIPSSVTKIEACAFAYSGLTHLYFDDSDDEILIELETGDNTSTFTSCPLEYVYIGRNISHDDYELMWDWPYPVPFSDCEIGRVEIGNCVTSIGTCAFRYSTISDVILSENIQWIGDYAFRCCKVQNLYVGSTPASIKANSFGYDRSDYYDELYGSDDYDIYTSCVLHVPTGCKSVYENTDYWNHFQNIVEEADDLVVLATGPCGDNTTYTIYSDMSMVIKGSGPMKDYGYEEHFNDDYYQSIQDVIIEEGITSVGERAFSDCSNLTSILIPSSVTTLGYSAFDWCANLNSIRVDVRNSTYDSRDNCNAIIETVSNTLCVGCKDTNIPINVTSIGDGAFYGCTGLTSATIPNNVTEIGACAFEFCTGLTSVTIPNSVTSIGDQAFGYCTGLTSVTIGDGVTAIPTDAFIECSGLTSLTIPNSVKSIGQAAFEGCSVLTTLSLGNGLETIDGTAFGRCYGLTTINIPGSLTFMGDELFSGLPNLTSLIIEDGVINIGFLAFSNCSSLPTVTIPSSVTSIEDYAFSFCDNLTTIIMESTVPPTIASGTFEGIKEICTLYVPSGSKSAYEKAEYWNEFENIVEYDSEPNTDISALDNAIYVEKTEGRIGGTMDISVRLKNNYPVRGFQFKLELPEGTTINSWALSTNRLPSGATLSDKIATQRIDGNTISVACSLNYGDATFTGNDGEIATVNVTFADDMEAGSYPIYLTACDVTTADGTDEDLSDVKATLVLEDYLPGDANGDGKIRIGDATAILNYIVGNVSSNFLEKAADTNGDGRIRIGDATAVLNIIVNQ